MWQLGTTGDGSCSTISEISEPIHEHITSDISDVAALRVYYYNRVLISNKLQIPWKARQEEQTTEIDRGIPTRKQIPVPERTARAPRRDPRGCEMCPISCVMSVPSEKKPICFMNLMKPRQQIYGMTRSGPTFSARFRPSGINRQITVDESNHRLASSRADAL